MDLIDENIIADENVCIRAHPAGDMNQNHFMLTVIMQMLTEI